MLTLHRTWDVRNEARAAQLAIGFLKGHDYLVLERTRKDDPYRLYTVIDRVSTLVLKYSSSALSRELREKGALSEIKKWMKVE